MVGFPGTALAQAAIAGAVEDVTGARLPGVTVQARSPALIEQVRTAVTDGSGQYRIESLRPGLYTLTFSLAGWSPSTRSAIEVVGSFTAIVDVALGIAPFVDAVTITGRVPPVDVRSSTHEVTLDGDSLRAIPTVRSYNAIVALVPGVVTNSGDIVTGTSTTPFPIHGGRTAEGRLFLDGLNIGSPPAGNSAGATSSMSARRRVIFSTAAASGEAETAGLVMNIVPKTGGNSMHGSVSPAAAARDSVRQSDADVEGSRCRGGDSSPGSTTLWRAGWSDPKESGVAFVNAHTGSTRKGQRLLQPERRRSSNGMRARLHSMMPTGPSKTPGRVTWQMTPRNKVAASGMRRPCAGRTGATPACGPRVSPEAVGILGRPLHVSQATWSSVVTSRLLLDAGFGGTFFGVGNFEREPNPTRDLIRVAEQCASGCPANGNIPGLVYRSQDFSSVYAGSYLWKGSVSYVTGAHNLKVGYQHSLMTDDRQWSTNSQSLTYRVDNGVPNQLTESISPWMNNARAGWDALFAQDQWTRRRLTVQGAVRFDRARSWFPAQQEGPSRFLPTPIIIPETPGVDSYKDITPRMGLVYDLFGTGRTALKMNLGKYLEGVGVTSNYANTNPTLRMPQTTSVFGTPG